MIRTSETILRAGPLGTMNWILVTVVATIIVAITKPVRFYTNVRFLALEMIQGTCSVTWASFVRFIRSDIILAVVDAIAHLRLWYTAIISASEFAWRTRWVNASFFVTTVSTIILMIALPRFENTSAVVTAELVRTARMIS